MRTMILLSLSLAVAVPAQNVPLGGGPNGTDGLTLVAPGGLEARLERIAGADEGRDAAKVSFKKTDDTRRLVALEAKPSGSGANMKALSLRYRLSLTGGEARLALIAFDPDGNAWHKVGAQPAKAGEFTEARLSIESLRAATFNADPAQPLDWADIEKAWVGVVVDGEAQGVLEISQARFTAEPYRATEPLLVPITKAEAWSIGKDPKVTAEMTVANEGPNGEPCTKVAFTFPGHQHMYMVPSTPIPPAELSGYSALEFTYRAQLPDGVSGLLVMLGEGGAQWFADPAPAATDQWLTITIPFDDFKLGGWSKDDNGKLDLDRVGTLMIGTHGGAGGAGGPGVIEVCDIKFVP